LFLQLLIPGLKANVVPSTLNIAYLAVSNALTENTTTNYRQQLRLITEALLEMLKKTCIPKSLKNTLAQREQRHFDLVH
jgi:secreted Zn-dependent insulinase-like peptidase